MGDLSNLIKELQEENVELFQKISEYELNNDEKQKEILRLREGCENKAELEEKKQEILSLNVTVLRLKSENETLISKVKYLEEREEDNRVEMKNLQQERSDSVKQVVGTTLSILRCPPSGLTSTFFENFRHNFDIFGHNFDIFRHDFDIF